MNNHILNRSIIKDFLADKKVLEIGPYLRPIVKHDNVKYLDILSLEELIERAEKHNLQYDKNNIPNQIDYIISNDDYSVITEKFDAILSAHNIEHQNNLIKHLQSVSNILEENGSYFLCIPDKRYCFDHYKPITTIGEFIEIYNDDKKYPRLSQFLSHVLFSVHNDNNKHWHNEHGDAFLTSQHIKNQLQIYQNYIDHNQYIDAHKNFFTPQSFYINIVLLYQLKYIDLYPMIVTETLYGSNEFYVQLLKNSNIQSTEIFKVSDYF